MKTSWTQGLNKEAAAAMAASFQASGSLRERLCILLKKKEESNKQKMRSVSAYEAPNWAYMQADAIGYERALNEVISLLE